MASDSLEIVMDVSEPRLYLDRATIVVNGRHWDTIKSTAARDIITLTGMLYPLPFTPEWNTTFTGNYARLVKAQYILTNPDKWKDWPRPPAAGNNYLQSQGPNVSERTVVTAAQWPRNQGFWLEWHAYNSGGEKFVQMQCGWGGFNGTYGTGLWFEFSTDGSVDVYYGTEKVGEGSIDKFNAGTWHQFGAEPISNTKRGAGGGTVQENNWIGVLLLPARGRDVLVVSNRGGGFAYTNEAIPPELQNPEITPPGSFWWRVPTGQATVQLAPARFRPTGALISELRSFRRPPDIGNEAHFYPIVDYPGYGVDPLLDIYLVQEDGETPFDINGINKDARVRIDLETDGLSTPFVYAVGVSFAGAITYTDGSESTILTSFTRKEEPPELTVSDEFADVHFTIPLKAPGQIEDEGAVNFAYQSNRPVVATMGDVEVFRGRTEAPEWDDHAIDAARHYAASCVDYYGALNRYQFQEALPFDGLPLSDAFIELVALPGFPLEMIQVEEIPFILPTIGTAARGKYALEPKPGQDTAGSYIRKLWETYASIYSVGFKPTLNGVKFVVESPATIYAKVPRLLFTSTEDAQAIGGLPRESAWGRTVRKYKPKSLEVEANDIWVHGRDPASGKQFLRHLPDPDSINPALKPSQRPANWLGEIRRFAYIDPAITTPYHAEWVCTVFYIRLTPVRHIAEWECDFQPNVDGSPMWKDDLAAIWGKGVFRIRSLSATFKLEHGAIDAIRRPTKYVGEWIAPFP